jgi:glycosyltransferase involved in cell wall biosynthesis
MRNADAVWTHTESQYLSILLLFRRLSRDRKPKLIAQSVWLFDRWNAYSALKRKLFSALIEQADVLTVLSPANLAIAKRLFPKIPSELVLFGIAADSMVEPRSRPDPRPLRIISLGNDEHRDWTLLIDAVRGRNDWALKIASQKIRAPWLNDAANIEVVRPKTNDELFALYCEADLLVLALKPNFHASGITVIEEAALQGIPVICSDTGGLRAYFSDDEVRYVPVQDKAAIQAAIEELAASPDARLALARAAQARMGPAGLSSESFARRHVEISRALIQNELRSQN